MSISDRYFNSVCTIQFPATFNRLHKIITIMIFQNFSLENLMRFVGKTFNLNTIILENQSTSFYQFISIIFLFIYIEVSVSFIKSEGKIEISSIRQFIACSVCIVIDGDTVINHARSPTDCRTQLRQTVTGEVAEIGVPDGHPGIQRSDFVTRNSHHFSISPTESHIRELWKINLMATTPLHLIWCFKIVKPFCNRRYRFSNCDISSHTDSTQIILELSVGYNIPFSVPLDIYHIIVGERITVYPDICAILQECADLISRCESTIFIALLRVLDPGQPRTQLTNLCGIHFNSHRVIRISHIKMICRNDGVCCFIELESHRVGQKADRNDHTGNDCQNNNPERRFLIIHHRLHTIFNTNFTKGKWAGRNHATVDAADHKSLCIVGSLFVAKFLDDLFITGKLNVTAKKYISQPHQRIEPMNRQQEKTKRLPPMVFAANVRLFVGNNVLQILTIHVEREIDSRFDNAQDKRRTYILTLENVALVANSGIHFTT